MGCRRTWRTDRSISDTIGGLVALEELVDRVVVFMVPAGGKGGACGRVVVNVVRDDGGGHERKATGSGEQEGEGG